jgi:UDP-N-acetylglucosamine transferase subunit ALG13
VIFVTVGTQLPFERLIDAVDNWARQHPEVEVFAQTGPTQRPPKHMQHADFLPPARANMLMRTADLVVAHAGMGSILSALGHARPILVMPRKAAAREHRNDHQIATARWLESRPGVHVAWEEGQIADFLDRRSQLGSGPALPSTADGGLVQQLHDYLVSDTR